MLVERGKDAAEVAPAGHTGTGAVQKQQGRALACVVIAQDARFARNLTKRSVVGQFLCHCLASCHRTSRPLFRSVERVLLVHLRFHNEGHPLWGCPSRIWAVYLTST